MVKTLSLAAMVISLTTEKVITDTTATREVIIMDVVRALLRIMKEVSVLSVLTTLVTIIMVTVENSVRIVRVLTVVSRVKVGYRQQRSYGNRPSYDNNNGERSSYNPNFNNNNARPHRPYNSRYNNNNNGEGGEQRPYRPRFNNAQQGEGGYRPQRPRFNNGGGQQGGYNRQQGGGYRPRTADYNPNAKYSMKKQIEYKDVLIDPDEPIRLNKFLANAGICSRREADEFITAGVVSVNGVVVTELGTKVKRTDEIKFLDQPVNIERKVYVLLNKPKDRIFLIALRSVRLLWIL